MKFDLPRSVRADEDVDRTQGQVLDAFDALESLNTDRRNLRMVGVVPRSTRYFAGLETATPCSASQVECAHPGARNPEHINTPSAVASSAIASIQVSRDNCDFGDSLPLRQLGRDSR